MRLLETGNEATAAVHCMTSPAAIVLGIICRQEAFKHYASIIATHVHMPCQSVAAMCSVKMAEPVGCIASFPVSTPSFFSHIAFFYSMRKKAGSGDWERGYRMYSTTLLCCSHFSESSLYTLLEVWRALSWRISI